MRGSRLPALELNDQLDALRRARRRDAEQILDVDDAEPAHFHVMARQLGARANQDRLGAAPHLDGVVGNEPVARARSRSSAHSLFPIPLSPTISTPRPRMSSSTPCSSSRTTKLSSRIAVTLATATGVGTCVRQHRQVAALGLENHLAEHAEAACHQDARHSSCSHTFRIVSARSAGFRLSRYRISLLPKTSTRPVRRYS